MKDLYDMIFKRKSVRSFDDSLDITSEEFSAINEKLKSIKPLKSGIPVKFKIVDVSETTCRFGKYCLLLYSEKNDISLLNAGYMLEQMDLFLASLDIGSCWYGLSKPDAKQSDGLEYIIMLAFAKSRSVDFRGDLADAKRKKLQDIWSGGYYQDIGQTAKYAPSATNSQPWRIISEKDKLTVCRAANYASIMPKAIKKFFNTIDIGIFMCFLEIIFDREGVAFERNIFDEFDKGAEPVKIAEYLII